MQRHFDSAKHFINELDSSVGVLVPAAAPTSSPLRRFSSRDPDPQDLCPLMDESPIKNESPKGTQTTSQRLLRELLG